MSTNTSLKALRNTNPRNQPRFQVEVESYEPLRARIIATAPEADQRIRRPIRRRGLFGLSAVAASLVVAIGVIVAMSVGGAAPQSAYAAARKALAATSAARSGTMTLTVDRRTLYTTRWNRNRVALSSGPMHVLGTNRELLLIGGGAYLQTARGTWVHYASEAEVGPKLGPAVQLAHDNVTGNTADQILNLATSLRKTVKPDGTTVYTGTIPNNSADPASPPVPDAILNMITKLRSGNEPGAPGGSHADSELTLIVGRDGLVKQVSLTFQQRGTTSAAGKRTTTWSVRYSRLGQTPPISPPTI